MHSKYYKSLFLAQMFSYARFSKLAYFLHIVCTQINSLFWGRQNEGIFFPQKYSHIEQEQKNNLHPLTLPFLPKQKL